MQEHREAELETPRLIATVLHMGQQLGQHLHEGLVLSHAMLALLSGKASKKVPLSQHAMAAAGQAFDLHVTSINQDMLLFEAKAKHAGRIGIYGACPPIHRNGKMSPSSNG